MKIHHTGPLSAVRKIAYVLIILFAAVFVYFIAARDMRFFLIPSGSMEPTLSPPEYVITLSEDTYDRGDIVVLDDPIEGTGYLAKRIIGMADGRIVHDGDARSPLDAVTLRAIYGRSLPPEPVPEHPRDDDLSNDHVA